MRTSKILTAVMLSGTLLLASCDNHKEPESYTKFKTYAESVEDKTEDNWKEFEVEYKTRQDALERDMERLSEKEKKEYQRLQDQFDSKKMEMEKRMEESAEEERMNAEMNSPSQKMYVIVNSPERNLALEGVTAENIASVYTNFVDFIKVNQDAMTLEEWKEAEIIWDALNERKNVVEPNLESESNMKIAKEKIQYGTLKTKNKPGAKIDEKQETEATKENR